MPQFNGGLAAAAIALACATLRPSPALAFEVEPPDECDYTDVDLVPAPESCEFRIVDWNASGKDGNWNLGKDEEVAQFVVDHVVALDANVITLQEVSRLSLDRIEQLLPAGWSCHYGEFAPDDHIAVCVDGVGTDFYAQRLRDVDPDELPEDRPPPYWWGYVQVEYEGVLITSVHTRSAWKEEHVTELHEDIGTGIIAGDFNYIDAHMNPNVPPNPDSPPGPDWHQTDLDLEWTIDEFVRNEQDEIIDQIKEKIDHILTVEQPYGVWGDACLDGGDSPQPFRSAHRLLVGRVVFQESPAVATAITNGQQPIGVDASCHANVGFRISAHDSCCIDASNLGLGVTASDLEGNAALGATAIDGVSQIDERNVDVIGQLDVTSLSGCPAHVVIEATVQDCAGYPGGSTSQQTSAVATLVDTLAPTAAPPPDLTVQCDSDVPPPNVDDVLGGDNCSSVTVTHVGDADDGLTCPRTITRTYRVTDECGNSVDVTQTIVVHDTIAPQVVASDDDLYSLWPPNHRYECFEAGQFQPVVTDNCDPNPTWSFHACTSSQPDNGAGDGNTTEDCVVSSDSSGFCARSERSGGDRSGRRYAISVTAMDACDNVSASTGIGNIYVAHSRSEP